MDSKVLSIKVYQDRSNNRRDERGKGKWQIKWNDVLSITRSLRYSKLNWSRKPEKKVISPAVLQADD